MLEVRYISAVAGSAPTLAVMISRPGGAVASFALTSRDELAELVAALTDVGHRLEAGSLAGKVEPVDVGRAAVAR